MTELILSGAVGGILTALGVLVYQLNKARLESGDTTLRREGMAVAHDVDFVGAADQMVNIQQTVIEGLQAQLNAAISRIDAQETEMKLLKQQFNRLLDDLENEKQLAENLEHELESYRMSVAERDERINELEARVAVLETALREADIDPDQIEGDE